MDFNNDLGILSNVSTISPVGSIVEFTGTGGVVPCRGTTAERPATPTAGTWRYNTTKAESEFWDGEAWRQNSGEIVAAYRGITSVVSGTTIIPADTSVPLSTEGTELWFQIATPSSASSNFIIQQSFMYDCATSNRNITFAVFRDSTCIYAISGNLATAGRPLTTSVITHDYPGTTAPIRYSMRVGTSSASTWYINRSTAAITFGGVINRSTYTILEVKG